MAAKKAAKGAAGGAAEAGIRLTAHPRAKRDIAAAKGWGGLAAFGIVLFLSLRAGVPLADGLWRGILAGVAGYVFAWGAAVAIWRHVALAEIERTRREVAGEGASPPEGSGA
jgi:hypothetical protein